MSLKRAVIAHNLFYKEAPVPTCISSLDDLKQRANNFTLPCYIVLGNFFRSSKDISYHPSTDMWSIYNYVDDSEQDLLTSQLESETMLIEAIEKKALWTEL